MSLTRHCCATVNNNKQWFFCQDDKIVIKLWARKKVTKKRSWSKSFRTKVVFVIVEAFADEDWSNRHCESQTRQW